MSWNNLDLKAIFNIENISLEDILRVTSQILAVLIGAMIVYFIVRIIVKRVFSITFKTKKKRMNDSIFIRNRQKTIEKIVLSLWRYFVYIVTFLIILSIFGINIQTIVAGAGILGVIFAVGSQRLIQDFLDGFFNVFEDNISVGDYVEIDKVEGTIIDIGLRTIKIKSFSGEVHIVPNSKIGHIINYSLDNGKALVDIKVDYEIDVDTVLDLITTNVESLMEGNPNILTLPNIMGVQKLDSIGYDIRLMCETKKETHWAVQRYIRSELMKLFKHHQVDIGMNQIMIKGNN